MKRLVTTVSILAMVTAAGPAFAAGSACSSAPKSAWKSQATLKSNLGKQGLKVRRIKEEGGCL